MNKNLEIEKGLLNKLYASAPAELKIQLEEKYGSENLKADPADRIQTLEDACKANGTLLQDAIPFPNPTNAKQEFINAIAAKTEIVQALNEGKIPQPGEYRYYCWHNLPDGPSGPGLSLYGVHFDRSRAYVASRLCTLKREHALLFAEGGRFYEIEKKIQLHSTN